MLLKILKYLGITLLIFLLFAFYMSPRLGGLLTFGKDEIDRNISALSFDEKASGQYKLEYKNIQDREDLIQLRNEFKLDTLISDSDSDFEKVQKIQSWVQTRWKHDGANVPKENNAIFILKEAAKGQRFRCVEYSLVTAQCLSALGFTVRGLGLMTKDIQEVKWGGGHVANEIYLKDLKKWVFMDPQYDVMINLNGVPLNAVELQKAIVNKDSISLINPNKTISKEDYVKWISPYLYYFNTSLKGESVGVWDMILGRKKKLVLYPIGAKQPKYFQYMMRLNTVNYTHSLKDFYPTL